MSKETVNIRVFKTTHKRLKVAAARAEKSLVCFLEDASKKL